MKKHISLTLEKEILETAKKKAAQQNRGLSNLIETILRRHFQAEQENFKGFLITKGRIAGSFRREDTYGRG